MVHSFLRRSNPSSIGTTFATFRVSVVVDEMCAKMIKQSRKMAKNLHFSEVSLHGHK